LKTVAILGPTASGKTALAISLAKRFNAYILSLDSLSLYREIDIASAKPTVEEREGIVHFGIDVLSPSEHFDVTMFFGLYEEAHIQALRESKNLIIVGGTGFYLKAMLEGLSQKPHISLHVRKEIDLLMADLSVAYALIEKHDPLYAGRIASSDRYRIEKWLEIFIAADEIPSRYLEHAKQEPILKDLALFEIDTPRDILAERIRRRTQTMIEQGLVEEVFALEKRYGRAPQCMKAIGIKEVLDYFDGKLKYTDLCERISLNTLHLAKRQRTFNASQFPSHPKLELPLLQEALTRYLEA
jgi:tRNA dimethylallyltransferase